MRTDKKLTMQHIKIFISSFFALFAVMRLTGMETKNPLSIVVFILFLCFFAKLNGGSIRKYTLREHLTAAVPAFMFCVFTLAARYEVILGTLTSRFFCVVILLFSFLGLFLIYFYLSNCLFVAAERLHITGNACSLSRRMSFLTVVFCLLCWSFYFLYEYPGIMTPDSINQYAQIIGVYELSNHHSVVHTALIGFFYNIGLFLTGSPHFGLALYTLAQMLFMALAAGYVVKTMQKANIIKPVIVVIVLFYALMPYNGIYAVTIWKDIPFTGCFTLFSAALMRFFLRENAGDATINTHGKWMEDCFTLVIPYIFSGVMICLLRTNGWYVFLAALPFILLVYKKNWRTMIPIHVVILVLVVVVKYPIMQIYDIKQADFVESLSIPVQQIARVVALDEEINEEQRSFVENIMDVTEVAKVYREDVSDGIKNLIRENGIVYLEAHKGVFFKNWFMIGLSHPKTYFDAFVAQTIGFWYPDAVYEVGLADGIYPNQFELHWQPVLRGKPVVKVRELLFKLHELLPLYGALWSMGFMLWILILTIALCFRNRQPANALIGLPVLLLILTLIIATPVATEFRYAYVLFFGMPLFLTAPFVKGKMEKGCTT